MITANHVTSNGYAHSFVNGLPCQTHILTRAEMMRDAPSIFATIPYHGMSDRYGFVPTIEVVDMLADRGFRPVKCDQSRSTIEGKQDFTRHLIRFRHDSHLATNVNAELPELVLTNSHDGSSAYRFMAGVFRLVCSNGLIVQSADFGSVSVRHVGSTDFHDRVIHATALTAEYAPRVAAKIEGWKQIQLNAPQAECLAEAALEVRDGTLALAPRQLLSPRRTADQSTDLWTVSNVIQENIMKGGIRGKGSTGRRVKTRPVKSVAEDVRLNRSLWALTQRMAELVG